MATYDNEILEAALIGYEHQKREIDTKIEQLRAHLGGHVVPTGETVRKRRGFSAATKKRMAEAQRKRWAAKNASAGTAEVAESVEAPARATKKGKRMLRPEARERIAAAQRKRWAKSKKAAKKKQAA